MTLSEKNKSRLVTIVVLFFSLLAYVSSGKIYDTFFNKNTKPNESINRQIDKALDSANETLPSVLVADRITVNRMHREGMIIYQDYSVNFSKEELKRLSDQMEKQYSISSTEKDVLPKLCKLETQKKLMDMGYVYRLVYRDPKGDVAFMVTADKQNCLRYQ